MVTDNYLIISSDTHAGLPDAQYKEYLDPRYRRLSTKTWCSALTPRSNERPSGRA